MTDVFLTVLRMSATGSAVILAVLLVRLILKKAPKRWSWALWLIVLFRLLTPFGIPMEVSLPNLPALPERSESAWNGAEPSAVTEASDSAALADGPADPDSPAVGAEESTSEVHAPDPAAALAAVTGDGGTSLSASSESADENDRAGLRDRVLTAAPFVWIAGAAAMIGLNLVSCALLKRKLREAVPVGGTLYETDRVDTAFVVGLIRPKIYLPTGLDPVEQACVAAHETAHVRRLDPLWRLLSFAALSLHWFNPLVWLAFRLSGRDMELSCDEAVLKRSPVDIRAAYSRTLVKFASRGRIEGPALAFGEGETGSRVKNVMRYKKPAVRASIAAGTVLVLSAVVLAVNLTAKDTSLFNTVYSVKDGTFPALEEGEPRERLAEQMTALRYMLAGDGSFYVRDSDSAEWEHNGRPEVWIEDGKIVSDLIRGIASPEEFSDMIRETSGTDVGRIAEARVLPVEPYSPNHSVYSAFFSAADGKTWYAFIGGRETFPQGNVLFLLELTPEGPGSDGSPFFANSLRAPIADLLPWEEDPEVLIYHTVTDRENRTVLLFMAGEKVNSRIGQPDNDVPFHFGIAVFLPEAGGKGLRLADCAVCPEVTVTRQFRDAGPNEPQEPGTVRRDGDDFIFLTEDGQSIRAKLTLPERRKTLLGKTEYAGACAIRFPGSPEEAYEVPAFLEALPYTRYAVEETLYHIRNLTPEQSEFLSGRRFEISGNCSLWGTDWADTWSYIGKGVLNPSMGGRSVEEWILNQTGVEVDLVKESRLFSGQMNSGTILFSTRDGGFYAASVYPGDEPDSPECRSLFRLRCETDPGNRLWIDEGFAEHTLQSALERDVHVPDLHTVYPPGIAVVPFVTGLTWKEISTMAHYDSYKIPCQIGAAVFELGSRSARLLKWAVCEDVSFTGWFPERDMISCGFPSDDAILFTLPDKSTVRADLTLPERKSRFFGLIERKQLVGECAIRFDRPEPAPTAEASPPRSEEAGG